MSGVQAGWRGRPTRPSVLFRSAGGGWLLAELEPGLYLVAEPGRPAFAVEASSPREALEKAERHYRDALQAFAERSRGSPGLVLLHIPGSPVPVACAGRSRYMKHAAVTQALPVPPLLAERFSRLNRKR